MIDLFVFVEEKNLNIKKLLISILLQSCSDKIKLSFCFKNKELLEFYNEDVNYFNNKLDINVVDNIKGFISIIKSDYVFCMNANSYFYDAFSLECLYKEIKNNDYDFVYGNYVFIDDLFKYDSISNVYIDYFGKLFNSKIFINNFSFDNEDLFMGEMFLKFNNCLYIDSIVFVEPKVENMVKFVERIVNTTINAYNFYGNLYEKEKLLDFVDDNYQFLLNLYLKNTNMLLLDEFVSLITPLDSILKLNMKEVV